MANAEVFYKWSNQGDGAWSGPFGDGAAGGGGGIVDLRLHAERVAWKAAWPTLIGRVANEIGNHEGHAFQAKIKLDQQVCPACQKWMIIDVLAQLKLLQHQHLGLRVELYAEVVRMRVPHKIRVQRSTLWPVEVGNKRTYGELPADYNN